MIYYNIFTLVCQEVFHIFLLMSSPWYVFAVCSCPTFRAMPYCDETHPRNGRHLLLTLFIIRLFNRKVNYFLFVYCIHYFSTLTD